MSSWLILFLYLIAGALSGALAIKTEIAAAPLAGAILGQA